MRVVLGQVSPIIGDVEGNLALCLRVAAEAPDASVVLFPELVLSGYPPQDLLERDDLLEACERAAARLAAESGPRRVLVFGVPLRDEAGLRNAAVIAWDGQIVARVYKCLLPTYDVFDEARYFVPGTDPRPVEVAGMKLGVTICEDIWNDPEVFGGRRYAIDPVSRMRGCDLHVNLSASPFHASKGRIRLGLLRRQAARSGATLVYCNAVGGNDELLFDGGSMVVDAQGRLLAQGPAFEPATLSVDLDGPEVPFRELPFEEEVRQALVMGIRDYAARCGFRSAVLGLSGGIDSAVVAALAAEALGAENVHTVGLPGPFSSPGSVSDAAALAKNLGAPFQVVPITGVYEALLETLSPAFEGRPRDVTEENLQARARGTVLMALSNKFGHLLLTTGNKSEMAVGYCTLYGDMNGGLAVISDLFKTDVYRLARHINRDRELIPWATIDKPPSAELAPDQKDQDSLPPYEELDAILRRYVEGLVDPDRIIAEGYDPALVRRVVRLVVRSEYKRWQAAPGLRVSPKAFGIGRRIPLAQRWHLYGSGVG